jgi:hypothetical protein
MEKEFFCGSFFPSIVVCRFMDDLVAYYVHHVDEFLFFFYFCFIEDFFEFVQAVFCVPI